jgi:hypothetical protein
LISEGVHCIEVLRCQYWALTAGQEDNARHGRRNDAAKAAYRRLSHCVYTGLTRALRAREYHVRLEQRAFKQYAVVQEFREDAF